MPRFHRLETTEHTLVDRLLVGDHPLLEQLRKQAKLVVVRTRTSLGGMGISLELHVPRSTHHLPGHETRDVELDDVGFQLQGAQEGGQAHVFVQGGFLSRLEIYNWADDWPQQPVLEGEPFYLVPDHRAPTPSGQRDMRAVIGNSNHQPSDEEGSANGGHGVEREFGESAFFAINVSVYSRKWHYRS